MLSFSKVLKPNTVEKCREELCQQNPPRKIPKADIPLPLMERPMMRQGEELSPDIHWCHWIDLDSIEPVDTGYFPQECYQCYPWLETLQISPDYSRLLFLRSFIGPFFGPSSQAFPSQADSVEKDFIEGKITEKGLKEACIERLHLGWRELCAHLTRVVGTVVISWRFLNVERKVLGWLPSSHISVHLNTLT